jgi:hypothetical protein
MRREHRVRRTLAILVLVAAPALAGAADVTFSLKLDEIPLSPRPDPRTEARLALWNDPMGRLLHQFNQQQSWIMRGTMPGGDRATGAAVRVKAQQGLPLGLVTTSVQAGLDLAGRSEIRIRWPWSDDPEPPPLEEQLALLLGERLTPR